jgi:hypothetical protein
MTVKLKQKYIKRVVLLELTIYKLLGKATELLESSHIRVQHFRFKHLHSNVDQIKNNEQDN